MIRKIVIILVLSIGVFLVCVAREKKVISHAPTNSNTIYKYKEYEKFDFENMMIEGEDLAPGDLSIRPRYKQLFKNMLPYRKNFNPEIRQAIDRVR